MSAKENKKESISDDEILSLWYTARPSAGQHKEMTYESDALDTCLPTAELRHLVELAIEYAKRKK